MTRIYESGGLCLDSPCKNERHNYHRLVTSSTEVIFLPASIVCPIQMLKFFLSRNGLLRNSIMRTRHPLCGTLPSREIQCRERVDRPVREQGRKSVMLGNTQPSPIRRMLALLRSIMLKVEMNHIPFQSL